MKKYVIMFILCFIVLFAGCARPNNDKKRIIRSKRYYKICRDYDYLKSLNRKYFIDYDKYNESYFKDNILILFEFRKSFVEVVNEAIYEVTNENIYVDVKIDSPKAGLTPIEYDTYPIFIEINKNKFNNDMQILLHIDNINPNTIHLKNRNAFYDCRLDVTELPKISDELKAKISEIKNVDFYFGNYEWYDVFFQKGDSDMFEEINLNGFVFSYGKDFRLYAYKDKKCELLFEIYRQGLISDYSLYQIHRLFWFASHGDLL